MLFNQLRLLLWKNFRLRKRNISSLIWELIYPLIMIFILIAVRTAKLKFPQDTCELREKQMASMGPIPFLRDFLCTFKTTCYTKTQIDWNAVNRNEFLVFLNNITEVYNSLPDNIQNASTFKEWYFTHPYQVEQLKSSFNYISNVTSPFIHAMEEIESGNRTQRDQGTKTLENGFCGSTDNDLNVFLSNIVKVQQWKRSIKSCKNIFKKFFDSNPNGKQIYDVIAPLIFGKIYYTPNSPFTREMMQKANTTFRILDNLRLASIEWRLHFKNWLLDETRNNDLINQFRQICSHNKNSEFCKLLDENNIINISSRISILASLIEDALNCTELDRFVPVNSFEDIENLSDQSLEDVFAGVEFDRDFQYLTTNNASVLNYKIRMPSSRIDTTFRFKVLDKFWTPAPRTNTLIDFKYYTSGFLLLQEAIDQAFIEMITIGEPINVGSSMQIMPSPCYVNDVFNQFLSNMMPLLLIIAWSSSVSILIKSIVYEKENRLKEFMKVMGLSNFAHWLSWFISVIIILIFPIIIMTIILKSAKILEFSSSGVIFLLILSYVISFICQSFMISVFFSKANIAAVSGGVIYFLCYMPFSLFVNLPDSMTITMYYGIGLLTQVSFCNAMNFVASWEQSLDGAQFSNLFDSANVGLNFGVGHCMVMIWIDTVIYLLITWYVEAVFPGDYGIAKPWYFPFTKHYWCSTKSKYMESQIFPIQSSINDERMNIIKEGFENEPIDLKMGISIRNLVKIYPKSKIPAVDNLNLNFYESQITAFLGHNGAGKTTTISILTGIFSPTSGTAFILDENIRTNMDVIRQKMGLCPQHNVLFDTLTVEDHIYFYGMLKGLRKEEIKKILPKIVEDVGLTKKINTASKKLSGGMKRKLSVAMAFIGDSRVVFLDEPTAGVDPFARRGIWDLLLNYRNKNRTIILTTHHMDEADYLSDRIAIISQGKLQCCGSSVFLKKVFGNGYYLILTKKDKIIEGDVKNDGISVFGSRVLEFIRNYIPNAEMIEETKSQWTIVLPQSGTNPSKFPVLFENLDKSMELLDISSYGLSDTSLEEVFLKVAEDPSGITHASRREKVTSESFDSLTDNGNLPKPKSFLSLQKKNDIISNNIFSQNNSLSDRNVQLLTGFLLLRSQIISLLIKRFHYMKRHLKGFIAEVILPIVLILIMIILLKIRSPDQIQPSMVISPWLMMPKPNIRASTLNTFYRKENIANPLIDKLESSYRSDLGESGVRCMNPSIYTLTNYKCYPENPKNQWSPAPQGPIPLLSPECDCDKTGYQICSNDQSGGPPSSFRIMRSSDKLANLTGYNISDYLLKNFRKFTKNQYGGYQFLLPSNFGMSSQQIGKLPLWNGLREMVNSSRSNTSVEDAMQFVNHFQEFFNLSGMKTNFTRIWINSKGYVSMPAYANIFSNLMLRSRLNSSRESRNYGIVVANFPLKYSKSDLLNQLNQKMFLEVSLATFVIFGLSFIPASFVIFLIEERISGSKRQQFVSGVNPYVYWISNYVWDITKYIIPVIIIYLIFVAFDYQSYIGSKNAGAFITLLIFYGIAIIPHMYPFSFLLSTPSTAFVVLNAYNLLVGSVTTIATFILDMLEKDDPTLGPINDVLKKLFLIFPQYDLGRGMMDLSYNYMRHEYGLLNYEAFDWNTTGEKLCSLCILFVCWWIVIVIIESGIINRTLGGKLRNYNLKTKEIRCVEDTDVANERQRLMNNENNSDVLKVMQLTKIYNPSLNFSNKCCKKAIKDTLDSEKRKVAVNNICFGVQGGECFGLLGVNGAGKTTTFKMLTGEENITHGDAVINGNSIITNMIGAHANMGFCPQFDALHALLSCEEQLYFYCRIRGIEPSQIKETVESSLKNLSLVPHASKPTYTLSGGNKRKLSTAIALIGSPKVIVLDEPTSGMDAGARRFLWNLIHKLTNENKTAVILTSHNMEECEVLCHRLSIMVNGEMKCLGSVQHLKSKFGDDYYVTIRMPPDGNNCDKIKQIMVKEFQSSVYLKDENFVTLQYQFDSSSKLSIIFEFFENLKNMGLIIDYSVSQMSLDDVFINFAKEPKSVDIDFEDSSSDLKSHDKNSIYHGFDNKAIILSSNE